MTNIFNPTFANKEGEQKLQSIIRTEVNAQTQSPVERYTILDTITTAIDAVSPDYRKEALHHVINAYPEEVAKRQHFLTSEGYEVNVQQIDNYDYSDDLTWLKINLAVRKLEKQLKAKKKEQKGREQALQSLGKATYIDTTMRLQVYRK